jgi:uncharacterized protein (DUF1015 family)
VKIAPLRGYRYARAASPDLSKVVAPPYDQISPDMQARLYAMSPDNIVRVTFGRDEAGLDRYAGARAILDRWLAAGVWARDDRPAIYPYHQTYTAGGQRVTRRGFVALGEVTEYAQGVVLPHERTHAGPKLDRMKLLEATAADIGLLFMLVSDPGGDIRRATEPRGEPLAEARDLRGELHQLWRVADEAALAAVQELMAPRPVIIADGHHRYETAVEYARRRPGADEKLMAFFALEAPGLTIFPNHRLVRGVPDLALGALGARAREWFDVLPLDDPARFRPANRRLGVVTAEESAVFALRDEAFDRIAWPAGTSAAWRELAVSILHEGLLRPLLGITDAVLDARTHVDYTADQEEALRLVREGRCQAAFLIAPTTPDELQAVVRGGEVLPQKSTHFYPKLLDGLVFHRLGEEAP